MHTSFGNERKRIVYDIMRRDNDTLITIPIYPPTSILSCSRNKSTTSPPPTHTYIHNRGMWFWVYVIIAEGLLA